MMGKRIAGRKLDKSSRFVKWGIALFILSETPPRFFF